MYNAPLTNIISIEATHRSSVIPEIVQRTPVNEIKSSAGGKIYPTRSNTTLAIMSPISENVPWILLK